MIRPGGGLPAAFGTAADGDPRTDATVRRQLSDDLGIPAGWAWVRQVHGAVVVHADRPGILDEADAVFTTDPAVAVAVSVADCLPVALVADGAAGMAHAGWRGAAAGVVESLVAAMTAAGHPPHAAVVGPGIGPCCFEVGPEVAGRFPGRTATTSWGTTSVDLPGDVADRLSGIHLTVMDGCTHHDDRFHSFRATGTADRQFGVAWIPPA